MPDPSEKYCDRVDLNHRMAMDAVLFSFQLLEPHTAQIEAFLEAERQSHSIGMVLDPTLYREPDLLAQFRKADPHGQCRARFHSRDPAPIRNDMAAEQVVAEREGDAP